MIEKHDYTIDGKFVFEQDTNLIYLKEDRSQNIELSKPAARLFNEIILLNMKKGIATRDELLTNVWEEYGLVGSNNNLNTYISEIRKKLELVGIDPKSIVTVPKKGFRLDNHLSKFEMDDNSNENASLEQSNSSQYEGYEFIESVHPPHLPIDKQNNTIILQEPIEPTEEENKFNTEQLNNENVYNENVDIETVHNENSIKINKVKKEKSKKEKAVKIILVTVSTLVICSFIYFFVNHGKDRIEHSSSYLTVSTRGNCIIQTPTDMVGKTTSDNIAYVNEKLNKYNISCDEPTRVILLSNLNKTYSFNKNIAISICKEKNNKYDCVSINDQRI